MLALALGMAACGDTSNGDQTDEAADSVTQSGGSGESGSGIEGGGEGGSGEGGEGVEVGSAEASEAADMAEASGSESAGEASGSASETETTLATTTETETETGEIPIDCATVRSELECPLVANCVAYVGQPFTSSIDGMTCLGPPQFLGCMFADMACLPATGTLCSGDQVFHVDNLCPLPEGFEPCEPPIDPPPANCP